MSAQDTKVLETDELIYHVYNKGVGDKSIFNEDSDYLTFLDFIKDYLTPRETGEKTKKNFTVRGKSFNGTPHLPKTHVGKVELLAYSFTPNHFHLILKSLTTGGIGNFMQSLSTRYSIYFNKKYKRSGTLFSGPYKSIKLSLYQDVLTLAAFFSSEKISSDSYYLGLKKDSWIKPLRVDDDYKNYLKNLKLDNKEKSHLDKINFDSLETQKKSFKDQNLSSKKDLTSDVLLSSKKDLTSEPVSMPTVEEPILKTQYFFAIIALPLLILTSLSVRHIQASNMRIVAIKSAPSNVLGQDTQKTEDKKVIIKSGGETIKINIRQYPSSTSSIVGKAKNGDTFGFLSENGDWDEVKLDDGSTGFISKKYIELVQTN